MTSTTLDIKKIEDQAALEALIPAWRELLDRVEDAEPTMTPLWTCAWWRTFGMADKRALRGLTFWEGTKLVGFAPLLSRLARHRGMIPFRRIELLATGEDEADEICSDYVGILAEKGFETQVAEALARALRDDDSGWDEAVFSMMKGDTTGLECLQSALVATGMQVEIERIGVCPFIPLPSSFDAYVKTLDAKSRYLVTRSLRELDKWAGKDGWKLHRASNPEELAEGRRVLHALHEVRWNKDEPGYKGVFAHERFRDFHDEVMPELLRNVDGSLELQWLTVRDAPVAVLYCLGYRKKISVYQSGRIDDVPKNLRIGIAMNVLAIRRAIEEGRTEYDFLNGESQYKRQLSAGNSRPLVTLRAVSTSARARALEAGRKAADGLIARARDVRDAIRGNSEPPNANVPDAEEGVSPAAAEQDKSRPKVG